MRHTAEPWETRRDITSSAHRHDVYAGSKWVCSIDASTWPGRDYESVSADAHLIAAAPDLLAAAKAAHGYLRNVLLTERKELVEQLEQAINHAEQEGE